MIDNWNDKDTIIVRNYIKFMNSNQNAISDIKNGLKNENNKYVDINNMQKLVKQKKESFKEGKTSLYFEIIKKIMKENNGTIKTSMIEPLNISRIYMQSLEKSGEIEKIDRGIYISKDAIQDDFYTFQQRHKKIIYSHMTALYFYNMTEEIPYTYSVTVPIGYHNEDVNLSCNVFYANEKNYDLGINEVETSNGNMIRVYDIERCICDIIKSKSRMDFEQVKKSVKNYVKRKDKDLIKLSKYAKQLNINEEVMTMVGMYYE